MVSLGRHTVVIQASFGMRPDVFASFRPIAEVIPFKFTLGDGTAQFDLARGHLDDLPIPVPGTVFDIDFLSHFKGI